MVETLTHVVEMLVRLIETLAELLVHLVEMLVCLVEMGMNFASILDAWEVKNAVGFLGEDLKDLHDALAVRQWLHHERR
jgi:hypothetical protein